MGKNTRATRDTKKPTKKDKPETPKAAKSTPAEQKEIKPSTGKKRPAAEPLSGAPSAPYQPETSELEKKRLQTAEDLRKVEKQIYELETKYFDQTSLYGNAIRGYEGFLGGLSQANRKNIIKPEERLFSLSSATTVTGK